MRLQGCEREISRLPPLPIPLSPGIKREASGVQGTTPAIYIPFHLFLSPTTELYHPPSASDKMAAWGGDVPCRVTNRGRQGTPAKSSNSPAPGWILVTSVWWAH